MQISKNLAQKKQLQHRQKNNYGENVYYQMGHTGVNGASAVESWYNEIEHYRFGPSTPSNFSQVGHFTQVVWKGSLRLGVGVAQKGYSQ
jgi:hypothetical protein